MRSAATVAAAVALALVAGCAALSLEKVHLVDHNADTGNFLFRGDMPCNDTAFAIDDLRAYLSQRATEAGIPLPSDSEYYLVDISLNNVFDFNHFEREFWADSSHASIGELVNYPTGLAGVFWPSFYNSSQADAMALGPVWWFDQTPARVVKVRQMLSTKRADGKAQVLYVHCTAGCDRTGQFIGSYRFQYAHVNTTQMYAADTAECGRSPNWYGTGGLMWYCLYFTQTNGTDIGNCEDFAKCDLFGKCKPAVAAAADASDADADGGAEVSVGRRGADAADAVGVAGMPALPAPASVLPIVADASAAEPHDALKAFDTLSLALAAVREAAEQGDAAYPTQPLP